MTKPTRTKPKPATIVPIPQPEPFRITGPGVYRMRCGGEARINAYYPSLPYPWRGVGSLTYTDTGAAWNGRRSRGDIVALIRLDSDTDTKPTCPECRDGLPSVNIREGKRVMYCPECGRESEAQQVKAKPIPKASADAEWKKFRATAVETFWRHPGYNCDYNKGLLRLLRRAYNLGRKSK